MQKRKYLVSFFPALPQISSFSTRNIETNLRILTLTPLFFWVPFLGAWHIYSYNLSLIAEFAPCCGMYVVCCWSLKAVHWFVHYFLSIYLTNELLICTQTGSSWKNCRRWQRKSILWWQRFVIFKKVCGLTFYKVKSQQGE